MAKLKTKPPIETDEAERTVEVDSDPTLQMIPTPAPAPASAPEPAPELVPQTKEIEEQEASSISRQDRIVIAIAILAFLVMGYFMIFGLPKRSTVNGTPIGMVKTDGAIRRRHTGSLSWETVRGTKPIYFHDIIYVPKDQTALITVGDKTFPLPADTMVQFDESSASNFEITLLELKTVTSPTVLPPFRRANLSRFLADLAPLDLRWSELKSRVGAFIGEPSPLKKVYPMAPNKFALEKLLDFELELIEPLPDRYNLRAFRWMKMLWTTIPVEGVEYILEVSKDPQFRSKLPYRTKLNQLSVQFDQETTFYWRVRAVKKGEEKLSKSLSFSMVLRGGKTPQLPTIRGLTGGKPGGMPGGKQ